MKERKWCWYNTLKTIDEGKISVLALVETLLCMLAMAYLCFYQQAWWYFGLVVCLAPFSLFKTKESCDYAIRTFHKTFDNIAKDYDNDILDFTMTIFSLIFMPILVQMVRLYSMLKHLLTHTKSSYEHSTKLEKRYLLS